MRGAGDILGTRQHGQIAAIGFHLYTRLLGEAVRQLRAKRGMETPKHEKWIAQAVPPAITIDLPLPSAIPSDYVSDRNLRLQLYRRIAELENERAINFLATELEDRFGSYPIEVENLLYQLRVKALCANADVDSVTFQNGQILLQLRDQEAEVDMAALGDEVRRSKRGIWLSAADDEKWPSALLEILNKMQLSGEN
jgi:transcription-repair coupling factor (superfamily II helicase)